MKKGDVVFLKRGLTEEFISSKRMEINGNYASKSYLNRLFELKDKYVVINCIATVNGVKVVSIGSHFLFPLEFFTVNNSKQIFPFEDEL